MKLKSSALQIINLVRHGHFAPYLFAIRMQDNIRTYPSVPPIACATVIVRQLAGCDRHDPPWYRSLATSLFDQKSRELNGLPACNNLTRSGMQRTLNAPFTYTRHPIGCVVGKVMSILPALFGL